MGSVCSMWVLFGRMLQTLGIARQILRDDMEGLADAPFVDRRELLSVQRNAHTFRENATNLVKMMIEERSEADLVDIGQELLDYFQSAEQQIESMLSNGGERA